MNTLFRHLAVRLWLTALFGGAICLLLLPIWQELFGLQWLMLPVVILTCSTYLGLGWGMNRLGVTLGLRQLNEANVWERAGMVVQARSAFQQASACFDSYWLSPFSRSRQTSKLLGPMARFYQSQFPDNPHTRKMVAAYLKKYPHDEALVESWLETLIPRENLLAQEHQAIATVSETLSNRKAIQRLLFVFYLSNGRTDFDAIQTYRRVWKTQQPMAQDLVRALAKLLRRENLIAPWTLQVYMKAYQSGDPTTLDGITVCLRTLPVNEESRDDLIEARKLIADKHTLPEKTSNVENFSPLSVEPLLRPSTFKTVTMQERIAAASKRMAAFATAIKKNIGYWQKWRPAVPWRYLLYSLGIGGVGVLALFYVFSEAPLSKPVEAPPAIAPATEKKPEKVDPFTIQVAAYVQSKDAQRFVDQLNQKKLDAFWTKATSGSKTWYQVKVSHFPTREAAQKYGQNLKSEGVIDDFYVANYEPEK